MTIQQISYLVKCGDLYQLDTVLMQQVALCRRCLLLVGITPLRDQSLHIFSDGRGSKAAKRL